MKKEINHLFLNPSSFVPPGFSVLTSYSDLLRISFRFVLCCSRFFYPPWQCLKIFLLDHPFSCGDSFHRDREMLGFWGELGVCLAWQREKDEESLRSVQAPVGFVATE